jgi:hypothetical protein
VETGATGGDEAYNQSEDYRDGCVAFHE